VAVSIEREVFPKLIGRGLYGIRLEGYWIDIGTPGRFLEANWDILERRVETVTGERLEGPYMLGEGSEVSPEAELKTPYVVGRNCRIGAGAVLERSVLLDGCAVEGAAVTNGILSAG
jgi:mannose-1-phosphate guanylyltransferase